MTLLEGAGLSGDELLPGSLKVEMRGGLEWGGGEILRGRIEWG